MAKTHYCHARLGGGILKKNQLGRTDIFVSAMGLGTVKWGRTTDVKYPQSYTLPSDQTLQSLLSLAYDLGVNLIDTAPAYGLSEERLGALLQGMRHQWIISTKVGEEWVNDTSYFDFSSHAIQKSIDRSLKRLKTDYLDIVLIHSDGRDVALIDDEKVFEILDQLKHSGKLRAYGMSTKTIPGGLRTIDVADLAMVTFHPQYLDERPIIAKAKENQKGIFVKKALNSGHLPADVLTMALKEPGVTSVIVGTTNLKHLQENVDLV